MDVQRVNAEKGHGDTDTARMREYRRWFMAAQRCFRHGGDFDTSDYRFRGTGRKFTSGYSVGTVPR